MLTDRNINENKYKHILNVWKQIEMKTMKDCHDLYIKCDVLLLADVFEKFRNNTLNNYGLCPSQWQMTKTELELIIPDLEMYIFFKKGTRGAIYYISFLYF